MAEQSYGFLVDAAAQMIDTAWQYMLEKFDDMMNGLLGWLGDVVGAGVNKCGEIKNAAKQKFSEMSSSPSPTPSIEKVRAPSIDRAPEIAAPGFSSSPAIQSALAGIGFSCVAEDLGADAAVGYEGVGCAASTHSRYTTQSMQLAR